MTVIGRRIKIAVRASHSSESLTKELKDRSRGSMSAQIPIFVVSSGRAGSTLLAKMIHRHPQLLCVSDIFEPVGEIPYFDRQKRVDGKAFFDILSAPSFKQRIKFWRDRPTTELLFLPEDDEMVSLLLSYTLPFLAGKDPMPLYDELKEATESLESDSMPNHLIRCFDWLRDRFQKELWVERTGGSLPHMRQIIETWPNAKIVHNFRDTRETAISMMTGSFFRLYLELAKDPQLGEWDADYMPPLEEMGAMLNQWIVDAVAALEQVPAERQINLSFESLVDDTVETLLGFSRFVFDREPTAEDIAWAEQERTVIRKPSLKFSQLDREQQEKLEAACAEGMEALGYRPATLAPALV
ncbi:MAG: sulfotransferase [Acidobacteriota bacterium]